MLDLKKILDANTMARTPFELRYFVAGRHVHPMQQYRQLLVEVGLADHAIRAAEVSARRRAAVRCRLHCEIEEAKSSPLKSVRAREAEILCDLADMDLAEEQEARALKGKRQELAHMLRILEDEYGEWLSLSESEQLQNERDYWCARLARSASNELISSGGISAGLMEAIRQMPAEESRRVLEGAATEHGAFGPVLDATRQAAALRLAACGDMRLGAPPPPPDFVPLKLRKDAAPGYPTDRIVECDRIDLVIGILHRDINKDAPLSGPFEVPVGKNFTTVRMECPSGDLIGDYKYRLALNAESLGASHLFLLDDDVRCPPSTIRRLWAHGKDIVGAWYPRKLDPPDSATIIAVAGGTGAPPDGPGLLEVSWALAAGCTLYRMDALKRLPRPWFRTTHKGTEDTYLTLLAREHGVISFLDRDLKVEHVDKASGRAYHIDAAVSAV